MIPLKKLLLLPFLLFLLLGCTTNGVDNNLYNDGKSIILMTINNVKNGQMDYTKSQQMQVDNFQEKYKNKGWQANDKNFQFHNLVFWVYMSYEQYGADQQLQYLDKYNQTLKQLKSQFNINVD